MTIFAVCEGFPDRRKSGPCGGLGQSSTKSTLFVEILSYSHGFSIEMAIFVEKSVGG